MRSRLGAAAGSGQRGACARRVLLGLFALLASVGTAAAQTAAGPAARDAATHLGRAGELYSRGRFDEAALELQAAYRLNPAPKIFCNLAQCYRKGGHPQEALENYDLCLRADPSLGPAERTEFQGYVEQLRKEQRAAQPALDPTPTPAVAPPPVATPSTPAPAESRPIYKRAWFWAVLGGVVVAGAVTAGVVVATRPEPVTPTRPPPDVPPGVPLLVWGM